MVTQIDPPCITTKKDKTQPVLKLFDVFGALSASAGLPFCARVDRCLTGQSVCDRLRVDEATRHSSIY